MPTSSQAMILINCEAGTKYTGAAASKSWYSFRDPARLAVASVYNINGLYSIPSEFVKDEQAVSLLGRAPAQLFKYHKLSKGFRSILSFDPFTRTVQWRILGGDDSDARAVQKVAEESVCKKEIQDVVKRPRPFSVCSWTYQRQTIKKDIYDRLLNLGFRGSGFNVTDDSSTKLSHRGNRGFKPLSTTALKKLQDKPALRKTVSEPQKLQQSCQIPEESKPEESESDEESSSTSVDEDLDPDGFYRILPSIYMRKEMPEPRPRSAIFSFRDNEETSHVEVRDHIQAQVGLKIAGLQYDPLNLRASKPGLKSRWIVDFNTVDDLETFVRKGLIIGKDKLIVYKYDDIARREFSSFKYFKSIQDAKKSLKGSKSQKTTGKRKKIVRLKDTSSYNI